MGWHKAGRSASKYAPWVHGKELKRCQASSEEQTNSLGRQATGDPRTPAIKMALCRRGSIDVAGRFKGCLTKCHALRVGHPGIVLDVVEVGSPKMLLAFKFRLDFLPGVPFLRSNPAVSPWNPPTSQPFRQPGHPSCRGHADDSYILSRLRAHCIARSGTP